MSGQKMYRYRDAGKAVKFLNGVPHSPSESDRFAADHPLVKAFPGDFATDEEIAAEQAAARQVTSVPIPQVAQPTEKRRPGRPRKDLGKS